MLISRIFEWIDLKLKVGRRMPILMHDQTPPKNNLVSSIKHARCTLQIHTSCIPDNQIPTTSKEKPIFSKSFVC